MLYMEKVYKVKLLNVAFRFLRNVVHLRYLP